MSNSMRFDDNTFQLQVEQLKKIALTSTDECIVATIIAVQDQRVTALLAQKAEGSVWKGLFCAKRNDDKIAVVFNLDCPPGVICLVKPWFAAIVDLEFGTVYGIQDPYRPMTFAERGSCKCGTQGSTLRRPFECQVCERTTGYGDLVDALNKAKNSGKFGDKRGCRDFVDDAAFKLFLLNELLLEEPVADIIIAAAQGCGHCACNYDVF
jgi:hypothetical protein